MITNKENRCGNDSFPQRLSFSRSDLFFYCNYGHRAALLSSDRTFLCFFRNRILMDVGQAVICHVKYFRANFNALSAGNAAITVNMGMHNKASPFSDFALVFTGKMDIIHRRVKESFSIPKNRYPFSAFSPPRLRMVSQPPISSE
jgi:hypothetical protein